MTDNELKEYYRDLLILQYRGKEKAEDTIEALVGLAIVNQLPVDVQDAFGIDTAVGVQLDTLAKYIGVSRKGFDFSGPITLNDDELRTLMKVAILQNSAGSSLADIQNLIQIFFPGTLFVFDYLGMRIGYAMDSDDFPTRLAELFIRMGRLPKPMGVQLSATIIGPTLDNFFGFNRNGSEQLKIAPFSTNADGFVGLWLQNSDLIYF